MSQYTFQQAYAVERDGERYAYKEGDKVELSDEFAAFVQADAPGTLKAAAKAASSRKS